MSNPVHQLFGNQLRIRICGICCVGDKILLVNHKGINQGSFWAPPGGGLQFGESAETCLKREFKEETGLDVEIGDFLFATEFIHKPLHAVELFFLASMTGGEVKKGLDPEMGADQIIQEVRFFDLKEIDQLKSSERHGIFEKAHGASKIVDLRGYFKL
jgi:8-oxo-dGTP diphosphatase